MAQEETEVEEELKNLRKKRKVIARQMESLSEQQQNNKKYQEVISDKEARV